MPVFILILRVFILILVKTFFVTVITHLASYSPVFISWTAIPWHSNVFVFQACEKLGMLSIETEPTCHSCSIVHLFQYFLVKISSGEILGHS